MLFKPETSLDLAVLKKRARAMARISMRPIAEDVSKVLLDQVHHRFDKSKTDVAGKKWKRWSTRYAASIANRGSLLKQSGALRNSYRSIVSSFSSNSAENKVSSSSAYAGAHETPRRSWMPQRRVLGVNSSNLREIRAVVTAAFKKQVGL